MWGSDWPVVELNGSYESWRQAAATIVGAGEGRDEIFGGTAARFYRIV
jgi:L-fuconolactonase